MVDEEYYVRHHAARSRRVAEIHGNRTRLRCIGCESRAGPGASSIPPGGHWNALSVARR